LATKKYVDDNAGSGSGSGSFDADSDVSLNQSLVVAGDTLLGINTYNKLVSSVVQLTFGDSPTTTSLGAFGAYNQYNYPTTNGSTTTLMNGSDSHIGSSVAISDDGSIIAIGAPGGKYTNYNRLGYVEIRELNEDGTSYNRRNTLIGNNGTLSNPMFGRCVALNGDGTILAVFAQELVDSVQSNVIKVYQYDGSSWSQLGSDITDGTRPGYNENQLSLNTAGTILAIGDGSDNTARIYEYSSGSWSQIGADIVGEASDDALSKVSLNSSGSILAVGAQLNDGNGSNAGHVRVFEYSGGSWNQLGSDIDGEAAGDGSGVSVSINGTGTIVAIGASGNDDAGNASGHIRVYEYSSGSWSQKGPDIDGSNASDSFGISVSLNSGGDTLAVGARNANNQYGYVRMYHYSSGSWSQVGAQQSGTAYQDFAGRTVAISKNDSIVVYGACDTSYDRTDVGSAKVYQVERTVGTVNTYEATRGLVGIGVSSPTCEVDISGSMKVSGALTTTGTANFIGDISLNSNLYVAGDASFASIPQLASALTPSSDYQLATKKYVDDNGLNVNADLSLNAELHVAGDVSLNGNVFMGGNYTTATTTGYSLSIPADASTNQLGSTIDRVTSYNDGTYVLDDTSSQWFGYANAINYNGDVVAIAARKAVFSGSPGRSGYVQVLNYSSGSWSQLGDIIFDATTSFVYSVALNGDGTIVAFAVGNGTSGRVLVYQYSSGSWSQLGSSIDGSAGEKIGEGYGDDLLSLNEAGDILAIGAPFSNSNTGLTRAYQYSSGSWSQLGSDIDGADAGGHAGICVKVDSTGLILAIGAFRDNDGGTYAGHVRVYEYSGGSWSQLGADIDGEAAFDQSGLGMDLNSDGTIVAIGGYKNATDNINISNVGHVRVYEYSGGSWSQLGADIDGTDHQGNFGYSVGINSIGNLITVGQLNGSNPAGATNVGKVQMYEYSSGSWTQVGDTIWGENQNDNIGSSVKMSKNDTIFVNGRAYVDTDTVNTQGEAVVYQLERTLTYTYSYANNRALVGIGVSSPTCEVDISGSMKVSGDVSFTSIPQLTSALTPSSDYQLATKKYVDDNAGLNINADLSLNAELHVAGDVSLNGNVFLCPHVSTLVSSTITAVTVTGTTFSQVGSTISPDMSSYSVGDISKNTTAYEPYGEKHSISDDGNTFIASSYRSEFDTASGTVALGYVQVYNYSGGSWNQLGNTLIGDPSGNTDIRFGQNVAISGNGNIIAISEGRGDNTANNPHYVYMYEYNSGTSTWDQLGDAIQAFTDIYSTASLIELKLNTVGSILALGYSYTGGSSTDTGHVRVYEYSSGSWSQLGSDIVGEADGDHAGRNGRLDINGDGSIVAIGSDTNDGSTGTYSGHIRVYQYSSGSWSQLGSDIDGEAAYDQSGFGVSLNKSGDIVAIGAALNDGSGSGRGHVRVYQYNTGTTSWGQLGGDIDGPTDGRNFGKDVTINNTGDIIFTENTESSTYGVAQMYAYDSGTSTWAQVGDDLVKERNVSDTVVMSKDATTVLMVNVGGNSNAGEVKIHSIESTNTTNDVYSHSRGLVGIGVSSPTCEVDISGSMKVSGDVSFASIPQLASALTPSSDYQLATKKYVDDNGLNINADLSLNAELHVGGDVSLNGNVFLGGSVSQLVSSTVTGVTVTGTTWSTDTSLNPGMTNYSVGDVSKNTTNNADYWGLYHAISDDGNTIIGGSANAKFDIDGGNVTSQLGFVQVYRYSGGSWNQLGDTFIGDTSGNVATVRLGQRVAISGNGNVIAMAEARSGSSGEVHYIYVYEYNSGTSSWDLKGSPFSISNSTNDSFNALISQSMSLKFSTDGNILALGHGWTQVDGVNNPGNVKVYEYSSGSWSQLGTDIIGEGAGDMAGAEYPYASLDINSDGTIVAIGATSNDGAAMNAGHVRVYEYSGGSWSQLGSDIDGDSSGDNLGDDVSLDDSGHIVAIGARNDDDNGSNTGRVKVYQYSSGSWSQLGNSIDGTSTGLYFGSSVTISKTGDLLYIENHSDSANSGNGIGQLYAYDSSTTTWSQVGDTLQKQRPGNQISSMAKSATVVIEAKNNANDNEGAIFINSIASTNTTTDVYSPTRALVGIGVESPSYELDVSGNTNTTSLIVSSSAIMPISTPSSASDTGTTGQVAVDTDYVYVCTATNTWKRAALSTW
jgi:hypothetical protein